MTPFMYQFLKVAVLMPTRINTRIYGKTAVLAVMSYVFAILARDASYWPIVAQIYSEVNRVDMQRAYNTQ